jgi:hypothetical protein
MTAPRRADLQLEVPTLEPDPGMLERLAFVAGAGRAAAPARPPAPRRLTGLRLAVATTAVAGISVGGAWATVGIISPDVPERTPVEQPTTPGGTAHPTGPTERPHASEGSTRPDPHRIGGRGVGSPASRGAPDAKPVRGNGHGLGQGQRPGRRQSQRPVPGRGAGHAQASEHVPDRDPRPTRGGPDTTRRTEPPERRDGRGLGSGES